MTALSTGCIIALLLASGALVGALISRRLPNHHLSTESKEAIKLATAIVGTLAALALGFLVASAKTTFDDAETELRNRLQGWSSSIASSGAVWSRACRGSKAALGPRFGSH